MLISRLISGNTSLSTMFFSVSVYGENVTARHVHGTLAKPRATLFLQGSSCTPDHADGPPAPVKISHSIVLCVPHRIYAIDSQEAKTGRCRRSQIDPRHRYQRFSSHPSSICLTCPDPHTGPFFPHQRLPTGLSQEYEGMQGDKVTAVHCPLYP